MSPIRTKRGRWLVFYLPYIVLSIAFGIGLSIVNDKADKTELSAERTERLQQDCESRVEARDVLRDVIDKAYTPTDTTPVSLYPVLAQRKAEQLAKAPALHCVTRAGIPAPEPVKE